MKNDIIKETVLGWEDFHSNTQKELHDLITKLKEALSKALEKNVNPATGMIFIEDLKKELALSEDLKDE